MSAVYFSAGSAVRRLGCERTADDPVGESERCRGVRVLSDRCPRELQSLGATHRRPEKYVQESFFFLNFFFAEAGGGGNSKSFLWGSWTAGVMCPLGSKASVDPFACTLCPLCKMSATPTDLYVIFRVE